ncbi:hypothetical protein [Rhodobacter maris]|uniref:Uncharacterized protein n=1 Tax=Rhodobacter maris TaxID=446682 RepID=A0A285RJ36_9RHOB|nr:hypothetical protein [Rhodobacter maris]SOB93884.1 hypothetical protein SAMN05877831_101269 [Rhodobacter maris]
MVNDFITMIAAGLLAGLMVFVLRHATRKLSGRELPRWLMPTAAGLAMLGVTIWGEYAWFAEAKSRLPEGAVVVQANAEAEAWRPWTYLWPVTNRFVALDTGAATRPEPDLVAVNLYLVARWQPVQPVAVVYDCAGRRQAILGGGGLDAANWMASSQNDAGLQAACAGG